MNPIAASFARPFSAACLAVAMFLLAPCAQAQDERADASVDATDPANPKDPLPLWEVGLVGIAARQPAYPGADGDIGRVRVLPYGIYRGSFLRVDGGVSVRALHTPRVEWDVSGAGAFGSPSSRVSARHGMPDLGLLVEIGPALRINLGDFVRPGRDPRATRFEVPVRAVFDVSDGMAHKGWTFEPRLAHTAWTGSRAALVLSAGVLVGDRRINDVYYGVAPQYATADRPAYEARAGLIATRLGASLRHRINPALRMIWFAEAETVRGGANEGSPLVRSRQDVGFGVSLVWGIWRSEQAGTP
ncbi:MAG: MipA/OmpV family protein [Burkholderiaceae bacterium]